MHKSCKRRLKRNPKFLNIITLSMKDLYKEYPDYITRLNSEMFLLLDPFFEKITDHYYDYGHFLPLAKKWILIKNVCHSIFKLFV